MKERRTILLIITFVFAAVVSMACGAKTNVNVNVNNQPTVVDVTTAQAVMTQIPTYFEATGNLASDAATDVAPNVAGKILEVNFDVGSFVSKGSVLVRLDPRDAQIRLEQAKAQVEQQRRALETAQANAEQARVRLGLKPGERFNVETFSQVKTVKANLELA